MPLKESTELFNIPAKMVNAFYQSFEDDDFDIGKDWGNFLPALLSIQPGLTGLKLVGGEASTQTAEDREAMKTQLLASFPNIPAPQNALWADSLMGLHALYSLIFAQGFNAGQKHILAGKAEVKLLAQ